MRRTGQLLQLAERVRCPVVAIHGDYDPSPAEGVAEPLSAVLPSLKMVILEKCGHKPWVEKHARQRFFKVLVSEIEE